MAYPIPLTRKQSIEMLIVNEFHVMYNMKYAT